MTTEVEINVSGEGGDDALAPAASEEVITEVTDAAVSVAEIEAAAEIAVAQIQAETSLEHHRLDNEAYQERTDLQWQELLTRAETAEALTLSLMAELDQTRAELQALIQPPSLAAETVTEAATDQGSEVIAETLEMTPEPEPASGAADSPAAEKPPRRTVRFL